MTEAQLALWAGLMLLGFIGSALFSGLETGAYSINRVRLQIYYHQHRRAAATLRRLLDRPVSLLTTLLIGNNIANYLGTASLAVILDARGLSDWQTVLLNTLIVTPLLFVFGETLPKDLFSAFADRLMYRLAWLLNATRIVLTWTGLVPLIAGLTRLITVRMRQDGQVHAFHPRRQVQALVKEGVGYGLLSDYQSAIVERVLGLTHRRVGDEMIPWAEVIRVGIEDPPEKLWELADRTSHSRFPVVSSRGRVLGVVHVMDALLHEQGPPPAVRELMSPAVSFSAKMPLREGLTRMQRSGAALAIVTGARGEPVGIVTPKDLVEVITGELASW
ncbi:MAG: CNNM domain-containing protein [Phycisphaeraceae bacterium]